MDNERTYGLRSTLQLYKLAENASAQQPLIERAEEDLLCALFLYRHGACGYSPLVTVCFLLHQAMEKWLKAFIAVQGISVRPNGQHDLLSRLEAAKSVQSAFADVQSKIEEIEPEIMAHTFPGNLRYTETPRDIERKVEVLIKAAFVTRRLVKQTLPRTSEEMA
jgi:HEPN domain-containing protein